MPKAPSYKTQVKKLDTLTSQAIRSHKICERCGQRTYSLLQTSHIISRSYAKTRFDPRNLQCLCATCHGIFTKNPILFAEFVQESSCGIYIPIMREVANDTRRKVDLEWWTLFHQRIIDGKLTLITARQLLDQRVAGLKL